MFRGASSFYRRFVWLRLVTTLRGGILITVCLWRYSIFLANLYLLWKSSWWQRGVNPLNPVLRHWNWNKKSSNQMIHGNRLRRTWNSVITPLSNESAESMRDCACVQTVFFFVRRFRRGPSLSVLRLGNCVGTLYASWFLALLYTADRHCGLSMAACSHWVWLMLKAFSEAFNISLKRFFYKRYIGTNSIYRVYI